MTESHKKVVTIFGASRPKPGDEAWIRAERLGEALATRGFIVRNGGYSGTMESASIGATKVEGGEAEGCIASAVFSSRPEGNDSLTSVRDHATLTARLGTLCGEDVFAFVVLPGNIGTLTELIWCLKYIGVRSAPVFVFRHPFEAVVKAIVDAGVAFPENPSHLVFVDSIEEVLSHVDEME